MRISEAETESRAIDHMTSSTNLPFREVTDRRMRRHNSGAQRLRHITVGIRIHAKTRGPRCSGVFGHHRPDFFSVPRGHRSNLSPFDAALGNSLWGVESCLMLFLAAPAAG